MAGNIPLTPIRENQQLVAPAPTPNTPFYQLPVKNPCGDLLADNRREDYLKICIPLYEASMTGNWKNAKIILETHPEVVRSSITENYETALHIAASTKNTLFVENLVKMMTNEDLELQNKNANTALSLAAIAGTVNIAEVMVKRNGALPTIPGSQGMMPLYMAALFGKSDMVKYLYGKSNKLRADGWTPQNRGWLLLKCIECDLFDVALDILRDCPELADYGSVLLVLARRPDAFTGTDPNFIRRIINSIFAVLCRKVGRIEKKNQAVEIVRIIWSSIVKKSKSQIDNIIRGPRSFKDGRETYTSRVLFVAAEMGNTKFVVELIRQYPDLIWKVNENNQTIFHVAVSHRQVGIYSLLHELSSLKDMILPLKDEEDNNMLHLAGKSAMKTRLNDVSGVALQMQRELLWFKEVEAMIPSLYREKVNRAGLLPHELFVKEHKDLMSASEKWMKDTASQCMVVAALIATIVFAAAFTLPGGYNQNNGIPLFLRKRPFIVFVISDAISLAFSSMSILIFLSILTSRYAEHDFLESLPKRLMKGLATLFFSIAAMMVAFGVSFFILYQDNLIWVPIVIIVFVSMPVILYVRFQYHLLADVYHSTYGSKNLFRPKKPKLYFQNPKF